jgi:hypothetical protein
MASQMQSGTQSAMQSFRSRSHRAVIRVYDEAGNVIETHEHKGEFKEPHTRARVREACGEMDVCGRNPTASVGEYFGRLNHFAFLSKIALQACFSRGFLL